jgi:hypothetical protein
LRDESAERQAQKRTRSKPRKSSSSITQFRAFDREALHAEFAVPEHWEIATMTAIGRPLATRTTGGAPQDPSRQRRALEDLL